VSDFAQTRLPTGPYGFGLAILNMDMQTVMKAYSARLGVARRTLLGMAILVTANQAALADTTTLLCLNPSFPTDPPFTVDLDQTQRTVTWSFSGKQYVPAYSNKFPATFDAKEIKFVMGETSMTINRLTGIATGVGQEGTILTFPCHVGKTQF